MKTFYKLSVILFCISIIACNKTRNVNPSTSDTTLNVEINPQKSVRTDLKTNQKNYYYDTVSVVIGTLKIENHFGSPDYGNNPETDSKENVYILVLENPIDVIQISKGKSDEGIDETKLKITKVQLANIHNININQFINKKIRVTGTFFGAITGHHHTPVLLEITKAELE